MNKKGKASAGLLVVVLLLSIGALSFFGWISYKMMKVQETGVSTEGIAETVQAAEVAKKKASLVNVVARDYASNTKARVDSPAYCYLLTNPTVMLKGAQSESLSTSSANQVSGVGVGDEGICVSFNASYYGDPFIWMADTEAGVTADLKVYNANDNHIGIQFWEDGTQDLPATIDVRQNSDNDFDFILIKNNVSQTAYNLRVIGFALDTATNISKIQMKNTPEYKKVSRLRSTLDYEFDVGIEAERISLTTGKVERKVGAVLLEDFDEFKTNRIVFTGDGEGSGDGEETVTVYAIDEKKFQSNVDLSIKSDVEDDQTSPIDVGVGDYTADFLSS